MTVSILLGLSLLVALTLAHFVSVFVVSSRRNRTTESKLAAPAVTLIRPLCGIENFSCETLTSGLRLDYPNYETIFCLARASDPVLPVVSDVMQAHPSVRDRILIGADKISDNPKLNNVVKGWREAKHDWIILADSNVLMPTDYIERLLSTWRDDTGLVCSPPIGCQPSGFWAEIECAFLNTYQARWQCFADSLGYGFAQGKTMLWRRDILERAGGVRALADELAEDAAATKIVRRAGLRVRLVDEPFPQPLGFRSAHDVWSRQLRWARLRRDTFALHFIPEILTGFLPVLILWSVLAGIAGWPIVGGALALAIAWYGAEAGLARIMNWHFSRASVPALIARDLMIPVLWVAAWAGNDFVWRGNEMSVADRTA